MSKILRNMSLAVALMVVAAPMLGTDVQAKDIFMKMCSTKYKAAKAANTPEGQMKWTDFMKSQCSADGAAAAAPAAPATPAVAPAKAKTPTTPAATTTTTPSGSFMQNCSAAWKALKASNGVPAGMGWRDFVKAQCKVDGAAATTPAATAPATKPAVAAAPAPAKPAVATAPAEPTAADNGDLKTVDKNGKPFTPAQMAAHKRAKECGTQWKAAKAANQIPAGQKWPQYWHECSQRMKAAGQ